jgi:hypothetical protein
VSKLRSLRLRFVVLVDEAAEAIAAVDIAAER